MLRRSRTTKKLAKRIDLQYFTRPHWLRSWRFWLSIAVPLIALGWIVTQRAVGGQKIFSSGPLARSHSVFTSQCGLCHVARAASFFEPVTDQACGVCHDAPPHHTDQVFTPQCRSCHLEHTGAMRLSATSDASCTQCHADLQTRGGKPHYVTAISSFAGKHPEFTPLRSRAPDPGTVKFNHYVHLQPNLVGPDNRRVQINCDDCHRVAGVEIWPYAGAQVRPESATQSSLEERPVIHGRYMQPIEFVRNCAACHTLQFDKRFGNQEVPHDKPAVVHLFLMKKFGEYIAVHPQALHQVTPSGGEIPEHVRPVREARNPSEWVQFQVDDAEWLLWTKTCKQCHALNNSGDALPEVAKPNLTTRWLPHAKFDHPAHRMMSCTACHTGAPSSRETSDVLLPGIQTCRQCHRDDNVKESAEGRCFECHRYHDWTKAKPTNGKFTIPELLGSARLGAARLER